jgi:hypothetical protein
MLALLATGVTADQRSALRTLAELGLDFELTVMTFPPHYRVKEYMAVNPLGNQPPRAGIGTTPRTGRRGVRGGPDPAGVPAARRLRAHLSLHRRPVFRQRPHLDTA